MAVLEDPGASTPLATMLRMVSGYWYSQALYVAARLDIAEHLRDGPKSADELARRTQSHQESLYRLLRALASAGVFVEGRLQTFELNGLSRLLLKDAPNSLRSVARLGGESYHWRAWGDLLHNVKTGETAFRQAHGEELFSYLSSHGEAAEALLGALGSQMEVNHAVVDAYDFSGFGRIVDVGGGRGELLGTILESNPDTQAVLFEQPFVVEKIEPGTRFAVLAGDFFDSVPDGADAYLLKYVLHDWNDEKAGLILENCRRAMSEKSRLLIAELLVPEELGPSPAKMHDLNMMVLTGGRERTKDQYRSLLTNAGMALARTVPTSLGVFILEATPL